MRMTAATYLQTVHAPAKPSKYRAVPAYRCRACGCRVEADDDGPQSCPACKAHDAIRFASQAEARRYDALRQEERLGLIRDLRLQVPYPVTINGFRIGKLVVDFTYVRGLSLVVEDVKGGVSTPLFIWKRKCVEAQHGIRVVEVRA